LSLPAPDAGRWLTVLAGVLGLATVTLAALGSHAVDLADERAIRLWHTAVGMLGLHAAALLGVAALRLRLAPALLLAGGWLMGAGCLLFSGTLLLRAIGVAGLPALLPPAGGLLLISGWACIVLTGIRKSPD
jgi:uncharacterized membrane protein YgdD (TMEM256/DUF423 family)